MSSPTQLATVANNSSLGFSSQRRMCELWDGSQIVAADSASAVVSLYQITNAGVAVPIMGSALGTTFTLTSSTLMVADLFVVNGASTSDIWILYCSDATSGATVNVAHCTYNGNSFSFDNTGTVAATVTTGFSQLGSIVWNGTDVIVAYRDRNGSGYFIGCSWTSTKNGSAGWQTPFQLGTLSGGTSQTHEFPLLRHSAKLAGGAGATALVYTIDSGAGASHSDQLSALILLDSAASAASANWKAEVKNTSVTGQNFGSSLVDAAIDPATGKLYVATTSSVAGTGGVAGHSCTAATVDASGVLTWGPRVTVDSGDSLGTINVQVDQTGAVLVAFATGTIASSGTIKERSSADGGLTWSAAVNTVATTTGDGFPHFSHTDDLALHGVAPMLFQRGTSTFTAQYDNTITCGLTAPNVGLIRSTFTQNDISGGPPGNGTTAKRVGYQDTTGNGWALDSNDSYGGAVFSNFIEYDGSYASVAQVNHGTSNPDGFEHALAQSAGNVFTGTEDPTFTATERTPTGQGFRYSVDSGVITPSTGPALNYEVIETVYPGPVCRIFTTVIITNPSGSAVTLNATDSLEIATLGGLTTVNQGGSVAAWASGNGKYATSIGGTESAWPSSLTAAAPAYEYCSPAAATGIALTPGSATRPSFGLPDVFGSNAQVQFLSNGSRLKFKTQVDGSSIAGNASLQVNYLQVLRRSAAAGDMNSIAADYANPDSSSIVSVGTAAGTFFDYKEGWYTVTAAAGNQVQFTHTMTGSVDKRWCPAWRVLGWTYGTFPVLFSINGVSLTPGVDYDYYVDPTNQILYLVLLKVLVASSAGAGQLNNGLAIISGQPAPFITRVNPLTLPLAPMWPRAVPTPISGPPPAAAGPATLPLAADATAVVSGSASFTLEAAFIASGSALVSGAATATELQAVTASGSVVVSGTAVDSLELALSATGAVVVSGSASGTLEQALSAGATVIVSGSASATELATVTANGGAIVTGTSVATLLESIVADGAVLAAGSASMADLLALTTSGAVVVAGSATLTLAEALIASGSAVVSGTATTTGLLALTAAGAAVVSGTGAATLQAALNATGTSVVSGAASLTASLALAADGAALASGSAQATALLALSANAGAVVSGAAIITTLLAVAADANAVVSGSATSSLELALLAAGAAVVSGSASMGTLALSANGSVVVSGSASITELLALAASGSVVVSGASSIVGVDAISANGSALTSGAASMTSLLALSATGAVVVSGAASILGGSDLAADGSVLVSGAAALTSLLALQTSGTALASGSATLALAAALAASGRAIVSGAASASLLEPVSAAGTALVSGTALTILELLLAASGSAVASGTADAPLIPGGVGANGTAIVSGNASLAFLLALSASGTAKVSGNATLLLALALAADGQAIVSGTAPGLTPPIRGGRQGTLLRLDHNGSVAAIDRKGSVVGVGRAGILS